MKTHVDLCAGIGGFSIAAGLAGYETVGFCEIDPFCRRVLAKHWPGVPHHDDVETLTADIVRGWSGGRRIDLLTGGYPCQPFSLAGKQLGEEDDRHLWPAIASLIAELKPDRCMFENVANHVNVGLDTALSDLEACGYSCRAFVIPAASVSAPHKRDRVWIIASYANGQGESTLPVHVDAGGGRVGERSTADPENVGSYGAEYPWGWLDRLADSGGDAADAIGNRLQGVERSRPEERPVVGDRSRSTIESRLGESYDGIPGRMDGRSAGRPAGDQWVAAVRESWSGREWERGIPRYVTRRPKHFVKKIKALGNAIVPQVAYEVLKAWR